MSDTESGLRHVRRPTGFTQIFNETCDNASISFKALGIYTYLHSKPDGWKISAHRIQFRGPDGRDAVLTGLRELQEAGYIHRAKEQTADGQWHSYTTVYDVPQDNPYWLSVHPDQQPSLEGFEVVEKLPSPENPDSGKPNSVNPDSIKERDSKTGNTKTTSASKKQRARNPWWDALAEGLRWSPVTAQESKRMGKVATMFKNEEISPADILIACDNYRAMWPKASLTVEAIAKHFTTAFNWKDPSKGAYITATDWDHEAKLSPTDPSYDEDYAREHGFPYGQRKSADPSSRQQSSLRTRKPQSGQVLIDAGLPAP